jgi:hypothetical protein
VNAHTDTRRRRKILNVGRVFVLNNPPLTPCHDSHAREPFDFQSETVFDLVAKFWMLGEVGSDMR